MSQPLGDVDLTAELHPLNQPAHVREQIAEYRRTNQLDDTEIPVNQPGETPPRQDDYDLVIRGRHVVTSAGAGAYEVGVRDGVIAAVEPLGAGLRGTVIRDLTDAETLIPGLVDAHVHINEPGRTEWEGFVTATKAAAAGGVTTVLDMPLNSIPSTVTLPALEYKQLHAGQQVYVNVGFWGGAVPGNRDELAALTEAGVFGFKCFLLHSGVDEFPPLNPQQLEDSLRELTALDAMMIVHAEDSDAIDNAPSADGADYGRFLGSRPRGAENAAVAEVIERTRRTGARTHILHLSSSDALPMLRRAKADGLDISVETCPHYLTLIAEEIPDGATQFKCCPPIREKSNQDLLWEGLLDGTIDFIASDHSPSTVELKTAGDGDFGVAWGGIAGVQLALPAVWTAAQQRGISLPDVITWMATRPADRNNLPAKGRIAVGADADLVIFAPDETFTVQAASLQHKNPITAYEGKQLRGVVNETYLAGLPVDYTTPRGRLLRRNHR